MIVRPFTFLTGLMFAFSGAYLFVVKHQSQSLEDRLGQLAQTSREDEQAIRVLKAQWALEADPSRIAALAAAFTQLKPMQPSQLVTIASLAASLPAPGSPAPYSNPEDLMPAMPGEASGVPTPSGPAIEVRGHDATASASGAETGSTKPAAQMVAQVQVPEMDLPIPPPVAPTPPPGMPVFMQPVQLAQPVHLAADRHESRSWIAPIPRQASVVHKLLPTRSVTPTASGYVIQTRAEGTPPAPSQPLGAQVVRVKAVEHPLPLVAHHDLSSETPLNGGSLLGMAQSGSQN